MAAFPENRLTFHTLYDSPLVSVREYCCRIGRSGPAAEEQADADEIVLMRNGVFSKHIGPRSVTADVNQAVFFTKGSTYRVSHPADCGDRGTVLIPSPRILRDILRELDPSVDDRPDRPFPFVTGPCRTEVFRRHRELVLRLESAEPLEALWADVTALQLMADVLEAAYVRRGLSRQGRRTGTDAERAERVEAAKQYLAERLSERVTLDEVARAAGVSPFHFARIFQQQTGAPVHRYLLQLRLRAALDRLAEGADDLTALALDLGFSSHSHFTGAFAREFGCPPSDFRRHALREISKNLEV